MLGYMTKREALAAGFTHHGKYFGIPCWIAPSKDFMVATKWAPLEYLMTVFHYVDQLMAGILYPDADPAFQFMLGPEIEQ